MFMKILKLLFGKKTLEQKERICAAHEKVWQREKVILEKEQKIDEEKYNLKQRSWNAKMPTSKMLIIFLFINFLILEIFTGWVTINSFTLAYAIGTMPDFTPLITLLGAIVGQTLSYWIYSSKAKAENTKNGIVYETAMKELDLTADG